MAVSIFSLVLWMGCATSPKPEASVAPEVAKKVTHLRSTSGMSVQLMHWGAAEQQEALLFFGGLEHPWAGKVVVHKAQPCRYGQCYSTEVSGQRWTTLLLSKEGAELYLPFMQEDSPTNLSYAAGAEGSLKPEALVEIFERQKGK
jgi:hypothetical protein